ncbi:MAG: spondin domain-containing protein [Pseudomonadota bacterium]
MEIRIAYANDSNLNGTFTTPVWFGLHDDGFDIFNVGEVAGVGLERIAEDGTFGAIAAELAAADPEGQGGAAFGPRGPVAPRETASTVQKVNDASATPLLSFAAMILPSNDAFIGSDDGLVIFEDGVFQGPQDIEITGTNIYDAGTEVNSETEAAFLNQTGPDQGLDQRPAGSVISQHPGFIGSQENPASEFPGQILGGTNAFGEFIDPEAADFTIDRDAVIGTFHVNIARTTDGDDTSDVIVGNRADDIINGNGGVDAIFGGNGWDIIDGGDGNDIVRGNSGRDDIYGGADDDWLSGDRGNDTVRGGSGDDTVRGGSGDDVVSGGAGNDVLSGGADDDLFVIVEASDLESIRDFGNGDDVVDISAFDTSFGDLDLVDGSRGAELTFEDGTVVEFRGVSAAQLSEDDFFF